MLWPSGWREIWVESRLLLGFSVWVLMAIFEGMQSFRFGCLFDEFNAKGDGRVVDVREVMLCLGEVKFCDGRGSVMMKKLAHGRVWMVLEMGLGSDSEVSGTGGGEVSELGHTL